MSSKIQIKRICEYCGNEFTAQTTVTRFCSHKCNSRAYKLKVKEMKVGKSNEETNQHSISRDKKHCRYRMKIRLI